MSVRKLSILFLLSVLFTPLSYAENQTVILDIAKMNCSLCVISINQALRETDGVIKAKTSLKTRQAVVTVPEGYDTQKLLDAVAKTGFEGKIHKG